MPAACPRLGLCLLVSLLFVPLAPEARGQWDPDRWSPDAADLDDPETSVEPPFPRRIDLNAADAEELEDLEILSEREIGALLRGRPWASVEAAARALDLGPERWAVLRETAFVREARDRASGRVTSRLGRPGDGRGWVGSRSVHQVTWRNSRGWSLALVGEKDPGETSAFDRAGGYLDLQFPGAPWHLLAGDFTVRAGQGLLFGADGPPAQSASRIVESQGRAEGYAGTAESGFLRGFCLETGVGSWRVSGFASRQRCDARLDGEGRVVGFVTTGRHVTPKELDEKGRVTETVVGGRLAWRRGSFAAGVTGARWAYSRRVILGDPETEGLRWAGVTRTPWVLDARFQTAGRTYFAEASLGSAPAVVAGMVDRRGAFDAGVWVRHVPMVWFAPCAGLARLRRASLRNDTGVFLGVEVRAGRGLRASLVADLSARPWRTATRALPPRRQEARLETAWESGWGAVTFEWKQTGNDLYGPREAWVERRALKLRLDQHPLGVAVDFRDARSEKGRGSLARVSVSAATPRGSVTATGVTAWVEPGAPSLYAYAGALPGEFRFLQASRAGEGYALLVTRDLGARVRVAAFVETCAFRSRTSWKGLFVSVRI